MKKKKPDLQENLPGSEHDVIAELYRRFGADAVVYQPTVDRLPTAWVSRAQLPEVLRFLRDAPRPYAMLYDLHGVDERLRTHRDGLPAADFTVFYHLLSFERNSDVRIKVALAADDLTLPTVTGLWPNANWYEREVWDLYGIGFSGHPNLQRIMMPRTWTGHPLRKDYPARATEFDPFALDAARQDLEQESLRFVPEEWGMSRSTAHSDFMFLNLGPNHPSAHGAFRIVLQLDGEEIVDCVPDIGYHHRGAEKMAERQSWHSFIPYTDRIDYLGGVMNNLPYVMAVEQLAGIQVPDRVKVIRVMLAEFFRITSHLLFLGTYIQDVGGMSPIFFIFTDRMKAYDVIEAITGGRMHPAWYRIGGVAHDLPQRLGPPGARVLRLDAEAARRIRQGRDAQRHPALAHHRRRRSTTRAKPSNGASPARDCAPPVSTTTCARRDPTPATRTSTSRCRWRTTATSTTARWCASRRCARACASSASASSNMPAGPYKADHPLTTPPPKERTLQHIETLINHFVSVSWGPVMPAGEACQMIEATKGINSYYLTSDAGTMSYRTRIRTPSFPHLQQIPSVIRGSLIADLIAYLASIDFVMADVDR